MTQCQDIVYGNWALKSLESQLPDGLHVDDVHDGRTLAVLLLVPVFLLIMFGYAISLDLRNAAIAFLAAQPGLRAVEAEIANASGHRVQRAGRVQPENKPDIRNMQDLRLKPI